MSFSCEARVYCENIDSLHKFFDLFEKTTTYRYKSRRGRKCGPMIAALESIDTYNGREFHFKRKGFSSVYWMNFNFIVEDLDNFLAPALTDNEIAITSICAKFKIGMQIYALEEDPSATSSTPKYEEYFVSVFADGKTSPIAHLGSGERDREVAPYDLYYKKGGIENFNKANGTSYTEGDFRYVGWFYNVLTLPPRTFAEPESLADLLVQF